MPPRYVIHIGPLKTGSTYIQQCLTATRRELQAQGVYYPPELLDPNNKHMHMPVYKAIVRRRGEVLRPIFERINQLGCKTVLLSCEHLIFLRPDGLRLLKEATGAEEFEIVYVLRRWSDRISSLWNQGLFMGGMDTLPEFYLSLTDGRRPEFYPKFLPETSGRYDIDYSLSWQDWAGVFGRDAIRLFSSSAVLDRNDDIFVRFCTDVLGLADVPAPKFLGEKRWASLPDVDAELLRALNAIHARKHGQTTVSIRNMMMRNHVTFDRAAFAASMAGEHATLDIDDRSVHFDQPYRAMSAWLDRLIPGEGVCAAELFPRVSKPNKYIRQGWLAEPGMADALRQLYRQMAAEMRQAG